MSESTKETKEESKSEAKAESKATPSVSEIKKELEEKMALEQELLKYKQKSKETEQKLNETTEQFQTLSAQLDDLRKKGLSKEEREAEERRQLAAENEKWKARAAHLETEVKRKDIEVTKVKVAHEENIPSDLIEMVSGDNEEDIRAKARKLATHLKATRANETVVINQVKEVGTETATKEGVQPQEKQTSGKKPQNFAEAKAALYKKISG